MANILKNVKYLYFCILHFICILLLLLLFYYYFVYTLYTETECSVLYMFYF